VLSCLKPGYAILSGITERANVWYLKYLLSLKSTSGRRRTIFSCAPVRTGWELGAVAKGSASGSTLILIMVLVIIVLHLVMNVSQVPNISGVQCWRHGDSLCDHIFPYIILSLAH